jgi:hypothetical protein
VIYRVSCTPGVDIMNALRYHPLGILLISSTSRTLGKSST